MNVGALQLSGGSEEPASVVVGRVLLARFLGGGQADLSRMLRQAADARKEAGQPILLWAVVASEAELPSQSAQEALQRTAVSLLNYCEALTLIVPGSEVRQTLLRSTLRGMATLISKALRVRVVQDFNAAARAAGDPALVAADLERAALAAGVVEAQP